MVINHRTNKSANAITVNYKEVLGVDWVNGIDTLLMSDYMDNVQHWINEIYKSTDFVYPRNKKDIFKAFELTDYKRLKVVIFGNEPYQTIHANGLAFGSIKVVGGINTLPHVVKIEKCLNPADLDKKKDFDPTLKSWAEQGILLLNTSLVSERGIQMKHGIIFRNFIREVVKQISDDSVDIIFVFTDTKQSNIFEKYIDKKYHHILHYNGIEEDSSIFEDINVILEEGYGVSNTIEW